MYAKGYVKRTQISIGGEQDYYFCALVSTGYCNGGQGEPWSPAEHYDVQYIDWHC